jgi:hypothetical protein
LHQVILTRLLQQVCVRLAQFIFVHSLTGT